jgi:hypothetical protein
MRYTCSSSILAMAPFVYAVFNPMYAKEEREMELIGDV